MKCEMKSSLLNVHIFEQVQMYKFIVYKFIECLFTNKPHKLFKLQFNLIKFEFEAICLIHVYPLGFTYISTFNFTFSRTNTLFIHSLLNAQNQYDAFMRLHPRSPRKLKHHFLSV